MRNLTNTATGAININTLSGGTAISILNNNINLDINKATLSATTSANDQYIYEDTNGNTKKILYSNLIGSSGSGLTAGEALAITGSTIDLSISKQNAITTSVDTDLYVLEDNAGNIKKITRANLLSGFINTNWTLNSGVLYPLDTATDVAIGATSMNGSEKLRVNGNSEYDGKITINGSNVLEATALSGAYNFNIQNTNYTNNGTLNLMGVNSGGATNLLTIRNDSVLAKMTFPSGIWTNNFSTNITDTELFYLDGVSSNIQTQLNSLSSSVSTNTNNIGTNTSNISSLTSSVSTNTSDISSLTGQQTSNTNAINVNTGNISTNTGAISSLQGQQNTNTLNISSLTSQQSTNTSNISTNSTAISDIKTKYDFTGSVSNGKLLIGNSSNYSVGELVSSDNSVTITKSAGGIDLVVPSSTSLSAGTGINITNSFINYDINKETAYTSPVSGDLMLLYDTTNSLTKKITFSDFNAGLQTQITSNDTDISNLTTQQNTNTSAIATNASDISANTSSITSLTTQQTTNTNNIATNSTAITNLTTQQNTNTTNIANLTTQQNTNTSAIATNTTAIATNTSDIATNTTAIATNTSNISTNTTAIATNTSDISTNTTAIATNTSDIATNTTAIATNTSNISTNTTAIATNTSNISTNTTAIATNTSDIATNTTAIATNTSNIATNTTNISNLTTQQNTNTTAIATNTSDIATNTTAISTNTSNIATNTTNIATNTSDIATNTAAISNLVSTANSTNFGTTASSGITVGNSSQTLALNSASMNCISAGKNFFRSNLSSGLGFQIQGYNSGGVSYTSAIEVHNVASGFPYLNLLMGNGFSINQYTGQSRNLIVDTNGKLNISNDMPITLTAGEGISLNSNAIDVDISKQVAITTPANDDVFIVERNTGVINKIAYSDMGIGVVAGNAIAVSSGTTVNVEISKENTITSPASGDLMLLEQASDGVLKNITFSNLSSSISPDLTTATSIGTAATNPITLGNAGNQILNLEGSIAKTIVNNYIQNRSSVSTGVGWYVEGYNSADSAYYTTLSVDNSSVAGEKPNLKIMDGAGFTNTASKTLTTDSNGKLLWATPSSGGIAQSEDTANTFIKLGDTAVNNTTFPSGSNSSFVMGFPQLSLTGNFNSNFVWAGGNIGTSSTVGNFNTSIVIGWTPFYGLLTSSSNRVESSVAIGHGVAQYVSNAYESVFVGTGAGYLNGTSNQCVFVGRFAKSNSFNSGYTNGIAIGEQAEITSSNQASIGNSSVNSFRIYGSWSNVSDRRDKYDIVDTVFGLDFINKLRVVDYKYNYRNRYKHFNEETKEHYYETDNKQYAGKRTHTGLISQEVKEVLDSEGKDHALFQVNNYNDIETNTDDGQFIVYQETISMCVKAIQELSARVIELEKKIN